ncbi:hypothetical protein GGX14DRAFT_700047 [Mycena pura]|uniref:Uncharacterized protein n=1 Tax=Mycena pura TaxID=153505 RepID=A0AAD6Y7X1_9AGAR|nr:hypothetical protein GGX14DRAFT_700047 [Mycena pura]
MPLPSSVPTDQGWQVVSPDWWRISFDSVSWAYTAPDPQPSAAGKATRSFRVAKPLHRINLFNIRPGSVDSHHDDHLPEDDGGQLNPDLVGLKGALVALESYELDVGFHWPSPPIERKIPPDLAGGVNEDHVALVKERWDELVQDLTGGLTIDGVDRLHESDDDSLCSVHRSTSTHSSVDLTDSDHSVLSVAMPSTPRTHRSYANIVVTNSSPSRSTSSPDSDRSPRRLNAAATTFVPSPAKVKAASNALPISFPSLNPSRVPTPPSPTFNSTFVFPSLNTPMPSVKITKDEQGFYSEVETTTPAQAQARSTSTLLPAFLHDTFNRRRPPASKTRAIVDKLRSGSAASHESTRTQPPRPQLQLSALPKPRLSISEHGSDSETLAVDDDGEGWIGGDDATVRAATLNSKPRRTRDLFLALTRRRSNSSPAKPSLVKPLAEDVVGIMVDLPSPAPSSNDEWIDGSSLLLPEPKAKPAIVQPSAKTTPVEIKPAVHHPPAQRTSKKAKRANPPLAIPPPPAGPALYTHVPPPTYYYPQAAAPVQMPVPYAAAYMHQMQVLQMQHQMHMRRVSAPVAIMPSRTPRAVGGSGDWRAFPVPAYHVPAALHPPPVFVPHRP